MHWVLAASTASSPGLAGALGLNWWSLLINAISFLIVAWALGRFVFPGLLKSLDQKASDYAAASRLKQEAAQALEQTETQTAKLVHEARATAEQIARDARDQAAEMIKAAETKAAAEAERIVSQGREQLAHDLESARRELKADTARLVAAATQAVLQERVDQAADRRLISRSLEEAEV